ncbi:unnamed protein product [Absidia cylindrospora]
MSNSQKAFDWIYHVNAKLDFLTNQVQIAPPSSPAQQQQQYGGWHLPGQTDPIVPKAWHQTSDIPAATIASAAPLTSFTKQQQQQDTDALLTTTFKLNLNDTSEPTFSPITNYTLFRQKPVIPLTNDILFPPVDANTTPHYSSFPHIPINVIQGAYSSVDHYLATHFELMRQDARSHFKTPWLRTAPL